MGKPFGCGKHQHALADKIEYASEASQGIRPRVPEADVASFVDCAFRGGISNQIPHM
jgi:hypothetical protein